MIRSYYETADLDFDEFLEKNSFEDNTGAYNCKLIKVDDIKNFWKYYTNNINANLSNIYECLNMIQRNLEDIEDTVE